MKKKPKIYLQKQYADSNNRPFIKKKRAMKKPIKLVYEIVCDHCGTRIKFKLTPEQHEDYLHHRGTGYNHEQAYKWATVVWNIPDKIPGRKVQAKKKSK